MKVVTMLVDGRPEFQVFTEQRQVLAACTEAHLEQLRNAISDALKLSEAISLAYNETAARIAVERKAATDTTSGG